MILPPRHGALLRGRAVAPLMILEVDMLVTTPDDIERLFPEFMRRGDLDAALALYEPTFVFTRREGRVKVGIEALREELAPFAANKAEVQMSLRRVARTGDYALIYNEWRVLHPQELEGAAIQVVRRQVGGIRTGAIGG